MHMKRKKYYVTRNIPVDELGNRQGKMRCFMGQGIMPDILH